MAPHGVSRRRRHRVGGEATADLTDGVAARDVVVEDASDHRSLGFEYLQVGSSVASASDSSVAVGGFPRYDLPGPGPPELAASVAFGDFRLFILGDNALDLSQQAGLWVVVVQGRCVGEQHTDTEASQFVEDENLVGIGARQTVRRQTPHPLEEPRLGRVTQRVKRGAIEARPGVAVVHVFGDELMAFGGDPALERVKLGADGAASLLGFGGDPGIERYLHVVPSLAPNVVGVDNNSS
jgi:hypothetical protein